MGSVFLIKYLTIRPNTDYHCLVVNSADEDIPIALWPFCHMIPRELINRHGCVDDIWRDTHMGAEAPSGQDGTNYILPKLIF